jgi:aspartokinase-like uncharacterized kinase
MEPKQAIFKLGGKINDNHENLESTMTQLSQLYEQEILHKIIIVPGGGAYADFIRRLDNELNLGEELAHWMAIKAMNYNGNKINREYPKAECIEDFKMLQEVQKKICIFLPYSYLRSTDDLPHNWDVTSDSIAFYIACKLQLNQCFLIKDVDGLYNINNELIKNITTQRYTELKKSKNLAEFGDDLNTFKKTKPIDSYLLTLINQNNIPCYLINGKANAQRIVDFFNPKILDNKKIYTKII